MAVSASRQSGARALLVVPTLGRRASLRETLSSIRSQGVQVDIAIVAPTGVHMVNDLAAAFDAVLLPDPGSLAKAINFGVEHTLNGHAYVSWLNDDDLLEPGSLLATMKVLDDDPAAVAAFGACRYIDADGEELWVSRAGAWAPRILSWGPDLIPQPGMLIRASAWHEVGGLNDSYQLAFDLDVLLRLKRIGRLVYVDRIVSSFRWHADSLTVDDRTRNLAESEQAKRASLGPFARKCAWMWEAPVRFAIRRAVASINRRSRSTPGIGPGSSAG